MANAENEIRKMGVGEEHNLIKIFVAITSIIWSTVFVVPSSSALQLKINCEFGNYRFEDIVFYGLRDADVNEQYFRVNAGQEETFLKTTLIGKLNHEYAIVERHDYTSYNTLYNIPDEIRDEAGKNSMYKAIKVFITSVELTNVNAEKIRTYKTFKPTDFHWVEFNDRITFKFIADNNRRAAAVLHLFPTIQFFQRFSIYGINTRRYNRWQHQCYLHLISEIEVKNNNLVSKSVDIPIDDAQVNAYATDHHLLVIAVDQNYSTRYQFIPTSSFFIDGQMYFNFDEAEDWQNDEAAIADYVTTCNAYDNADDDADDDDDDNAGDDDDDADEDEDGDN